MTVTPHEHARLLKLATTASVATALLLLGCKLGAWLWTGSVSVLASLVDSLLDAAASLLNLLAVRYALTPPDREHRFGHGKAEALAGLGQAALIASSALLLLRYALDRLHTPQPLTDPAVGIGVMVFAIVATLLLLALQRHVIRQTGSTAIRADALHYATDVLTHLGIIAALVLAAYGWPGFDPVFALGIAAYVLYSAGQIGFEAVQLLLDRELPEAEQAQIRTIVQAQAQVRGLHDLRTRRAGATCFIQLHLELDADLTLAQAHAVADAVEAALQEAFPGADILIHEDPITPAP